MSTIRRGRAAVLGSVAALALALSACAGAPSDDTDTVSSSKVPDKPKKAVTLNILDIAGNLQLTKGMIENFAKANPDVVSKVTYATAPAPDMAGKLKAEQQGGSSTTSLVLSGTDGLSAGIQQKLLRKITPDFDERLPGLMDNYLEPAANMQKLADGYGVAVVYYPSGPLMEYNPAKVKTAPKTPQELLDYAKAHPGKVQYAQPANSGPGRTFLMGLPYLLGDTDPKDPEKGWDKTWAYLKELGKYTADYASGTTETMKNLADGTVDIVLSTTGWDINPRALGTVPADMKIAAFDNMTWVSDAQYVLIPKGVSSDVVAADLALIKWMLKPDQQAIAYDSGYFYPGPAVKDVDLSMAPQASQDVIKRFGRPEYDALIADNPVQTSLPSAQQVAAFDTWDREVGSQK
ncbi:putative spermidine/putrescine transport system substrate-binding protein [Nocardioides terrae]|uniref:Putative spermidine/putrescine transport system substrate-binding protein n=1 Tax=Nocardioides terrae TaxID=574651 RepID=A0A1I1LA22_9ACTN|nr:extracellular solute-binding protein [Nocardioides terrae]SFC67233.1 putative spermidine/putrescine transport system substrate-binding protein [Nocardioides terrae]